ncbi:ribonuclease P protein component [Methylococcus geothermalis]|uniref:Ribonuclease P protein component n=1 Tax=Methylococcus geothermalis TaxID=2681310 RepID=A0A858Q532_9GAMM|nr:ribonuclease P protein component [Methylococcus geothermalis]QJD28846.1 ribonuclease P protein component [Methylococcus geothermalis]
MERPVPGQGYGFPRSHRLVSPVEFRSVFEEAFRSSDSWLTVLARPNDRAHARLGLALSRKQIRKAVDRNRIKRLVRESFRCRQAELGAFDYVVMARTPATAVNSAVLRRALEKHWLRLTRRCSDSSSP